MLKFKKNDEIIVLKGKDKGKVGKILKVLPAKNRAFVVGVNLVKKHIKANPQAGVSGGVIKKEASIDVSNLAIYNSKNKKADYVKIKILENKQKVRCFKSDQELISF